MRKHKKYSILVFLFILVSGFSSQIYSQVVSFDLTIKSNSKMEMVEMEEEVPPGVFIDISNQIYDWVKISNYKNFDILIEVIARDIYVNAEDALPCYIEIFNTTNRIYKQKFDDVFYLLPVAQYLYIEEDYIKDPKKYQTFIGFPIKETKEVIVTYN